MPPICNASQTYGLPWIEASKSFRLGGFRPSPLRGGSNGLDSTDEPNHVDLLVSQRECNQVPDFAGPRGLNSLPGETSLRIPSESAFEAESRSVSECGVENTCFESLDE